MVAWPDVVPLTALVLPLMLGSLLPGPRQLPWFVVFVLVLLMRRCCPHADVNAAPCWRSRPLPARLHHPAHVVPALPARRRRRAGGVDAGRPARPDPRPGRHPGAARAAGTPSPRCARPAARRSPGDFIVAAVQHGRPARRRRWSTCPARGSGPAPARCCSPARSAGCSTALPPAEFLPAANDYLLRQDWEEGFATAVHLSLDLATGAFEIRTAGHPPAVQLAAGVGTLDGAATPRARCSG